MSKQAGLRLTLAGVKETKRQYRRMRKRLVRHVDDLRWIVARCGDLLETLSRGNPGAGGRR